ncbi:MAG: hypothetical protein KAJ55_00230 [Anaerolineales bacterium]|nr:hypothetical protein [Anaerolineales bacterium]
MPEAMTTSSEDEVDVGGRPTVYTEELATNICHRLADGESLRKICEDPKMPNASTVHLWVLQDREEFSKQYTDARMAQALYWADELVEISDQKETEEIHQRSRLRVDTRKWALSKVLPKVFGEKIAHTGPDGGPIKIEHLVAPRRLGENNSS